AGLFATTCEGCVSSPLGGEAVAGGGTATNETPGPGFSVSEDSVFGVFSLVSVMSLSSQKASAFYFAGLRITRQQVVDHRARCAGADFHFLVFFGDCFQRSG